MQVCQYLIHLCLFPLLPGSYFCYDNPAALQDNMIRDLKISESQFMGFYSWYSWPNVILCFFGGFLIDRVFGVRWGAIIFSLFVTVGQVCFVYIICIKLMEVISECQEQRTGY